MKHSVQIAAAVAALLMVPSFANASGHYRDQVRREVRRAVAEARREAGRARFR